MSLEPPGGPDVSVSGRPTRRRLALAILVGLLGTGVLVLGTCALIVHNAVQCYGGACTPEGQARASADAAYQAEFQRRLGGPPPAGCGTAPVPVHPAVAGSIWDPSGDTGSIAAGKSPVWFRIDGLTLDHGRAVEHLAANYYDLPQQYGDLPDGAPGFPVFLTWLTDAAYTNVINVSVSDLASGGVIPAQLTTPTDSVGTWSMHDPDVLDPSESGAIDPGSPNPYREFRTVVTLVSGGCYAVTAKWPGGGWSITVAVGK